MQNKKGLFIAFEGVDGCGKTTVSQLVQKKLQDFFKEDNKVIWTREPGGTEVGEKIREILTSYNVDPRTEALLFAASRSENTWKNIMKNVANKKIVLCDRYLDSSLVYQGIIKKLGVKDVLKINLFGIGKVRPDMIFYLKIDENEAFKRILREESRNKDSDILQNQFEKQEQIRKIINGYSSIWDPINKKNVHTINANKPIEDVAQRIFDIIISRVKVDANKPKNI